MHTLSEQFHATNMVSFECGCVCGGGGMCVACVLVVFAQGCCRCAAADVLWLEIEDAGMQWSCQCSEC